MRARRTSRLLLALGLLLLGGLLLSGGVHAVVHADDAAPCDVCHLAGDAPDEPILELDPRAVAEVGGTAPVDRLLEREADGPHAPRGPPSEVGSGSLRGPLPRP